MIEPHSGSTSLGRPNTPQRCDGLGVHLSFQLDSSEILGDLVCIVAPKRTVGTIGLRSTKAMAIGAGRAPSFGHEADHRLAHREHRP